MGLVKADAQKDSEGSGAQPKVNGASVNDEATTLAPADDEYADDVEK